MEAELRAWWRADAGAGTDAMLERLLARHREPHRRYHGVAHVRAVVGRCRTLLTTVPVPDPGAVCLAAWYHDAVYDPRAEPGANEAASARLAVADLTALGFPAERCAEVARLVELTAGHEVDDGDQAGAVLVDADLAVLGAEPGAYSAYVAGVRAEYAHVDEAAWRIGRAAVLRRLLALDPLLRTPPMQSTVARARANLTAELASLTA
ncbi:MAG: metal-dependent phosphohydrolase [Acidimicrobiales bacterium]